MVALTTLILVLYLQQPTLLPTSKPTQLKMCTLFEGQFSDTDCDSCKPAVAMDGDNAVIAANGGHVQFLSHNNGAFEAVESFGNLLASEWSTTVSGNFAVVGAPYENDRTGQISVYGKASSGMWYHLSHIVPSDIDAGATFGWASDIDDDIMIVGAENDRGIGSAYIYRLVGTIWKQEAKLAPVDSNMQSFGRTVGVKGRVVAVGDPWYGENNEGAVFIYEFDTLCNSWTRLEIVKNSGCDGFFGSSLALSADGGLTIGCPLANELAGAVYYYEKGSNRYELTQEVTASNGTSEDYFGASVSIESNIMTVGTFNEGNGKVYVFGKVDGIWNEVDQITAPSGSVYFGGELVLAGNSILVSAFNNVYYYTMEMC
jgi:hypothetical protein